MDRFYDTTNAGKKNFANLSGFTFSPGLAITLEKEASSIRKAMAQRADSASQHLADLDVSNVN
jgi:hypothetical protein